MKHLHVSANDKFINPYINFINKNFTPKDHTFIILGKGIGVQITPSINVIQSSNKIFSLAVLLKQMYRSDRIYLHGLFFPQIIFLLFFQPWLIKKCNWIIWGGDLYSYRTPKKTFMDRVREAMRRQVIRNIGGLITHIKGDYELAKSWYGAKGKHYYSFMYPSNLYKKYDLNKVNQSNDKLYIQVGNSADPSNNHIEIFEKLVAFNSQKDYEIICPLSYGNPSYAESVIEKGYEFFGENFKPLKSFIPFDAYLEILAKIDIAIFNHKRQQAVGNITTLLSLEKKVYIRDDITTWEFCKEHNLIVYSVNNEFEGLFEPLSIEVKNMNKANMKKQFSEEKLVSDWEFIFSKS